MSEQSTEVHGVTIETSDRTLIITDLNQPVWHGDYHGGKLSLYHVMVDGAYNPDQLTVVAIFTDIENNDFVFSSDYVSNLSFEEIASHICALVVIEYQKQKSLPASTYAPGTDTLQ